jgi:hypothetical protein
MGSVDSELLHISSEQSQCKQSRGNYLLLLVMFSLNKPHSPHFITIPIGI